VRQPGSKPLASIILASAETADFSSLRPKVLHEVARVPMVVRVVNTVRSVCDCRIVVAVGQLEGFDAVRDTFDENVELVEQSPEMSATGVLAQCEPLFDGFDGDLLVLRGDCPLLRGETIGRLVSEHKSSGMDVTALTSSADDRANSGNFCADARRLFDGLRTNEPGGEIGTVVAEDAAELMVVESRAQLAEAERVCWQRRRDELMAHGVTLHEPETIYVADTARVGSDTELWPNTYLVGETSIGAMCKIGPETYIEGCTVADGVSIEYSHCTGARVEVGARVGPFSRLRPGTVVGPGDKIGNFVEIKNSQIGVRANVSHLSYIGDATLGDNVNVGAGTITANYDGVRKHRTVIEDDVRIGSDTVLVAPVTVGRGARTGAGAVVLSNRDVSPGATVVGVPAREVGPREEQPEEKEQV